MEFTNKISTPGERLKYIRNLAQLTRQTVRDKFKISSATLRSWEEDKVVISDKKIRLCLEAYKSVGIITDLDWIKTGKGNLSIQQTNDQNFIEKFLFSSEDQNTEELDLDFLKSQNINSTSFISYIDKDEKFTFINSKYIELFQKSANEIIGKTLREMIGEQGYKNIKPFLAKTYAGSEVNFEYPWEYEPNHYRYLHLNFIPHKIKDEIIGFFSFIEDKEPPVPYISNIEESDNRHDNQVFIDSVLLTNKILKESGKIFTPHILTKLSYDLYLHSLKNNAIDENYAKDLIAKLK